MTLEEALELLEAVEQTYLRGDPQAASEQAQALVDEVRGAFEARGNRADAVETWVMGSVFLLAAEWLRQPEAFDESATAASLLQRARDLLQSVGDERGVAACVRSLGELSFYEARTADARRLLEDALSRYEALLDPLGVAHCLISLGQLAQHAAEPAQARRLFEDALSRYEALPDPQGVANCIYSLGDLARRVDETDDARRLLEDAVSRYKALLDPRGEAHCISSLAELVQRAGETGEARRLFEEAAALYRSVGDPMEAWCLMLRARLTPDASERLRLAQRAVEVVERVRLSLDAAYARQQHSLQWQQVYVEAIRSARLAGEQDEALRLATLLTGRLLYERQLSEGVDPRSLLSGEEVTAFEGLTNAVAQAERLLRTLGADTPERRDAQQELQRSLSEKRRLHEQAELRVRVEPPPPVDVAALKAELRRRDATLVFLLWQPELHTALVVHPHGVIEFVDYDGVPGGVDTKGHSLRAVQAVDAAFVALQAEAQQQVASADSLWRSRVVRPLHRLLGNPCSGSRGMARSTSSPTPHSPRRRCVPGHAISPSSPPPGHCLRVHPCRRCRARSSPSAAMSPAGSVARRLTSRWSAARAV